MDRVKSLDFSLKVRWGHTEDFLADERFMVELQAS